MEEKNTLSINRMNLKTKPIISNMVVLTNNKIAANDIDTFITHGSPSPIIITQVSLTNNKNIMGWDRHKLINTSATLVRTRIPTPGKMNFDTNHLASYLQ